MIQQTISAHFKCSRKQRLIIARVWADDKWMRREKNGEQFAKWITLTLTIHTHAGFEYGLLMYVFFHFAVSLSNRNETNESCSRNKTLFRNLRLKIEFEVLWLFYLLPFLSHFSLSLIRFSFARHWLCVRFSFLNFFVINGLVFARANKHTHHSTPTAAEISNGDWSQTADADAGCAHTHCGMQILFSSHVKQIKM